MFGNSPRFCDGCRIFGPLFRKRERRRDPLRTEPAAPEDDCTGSATGNPTQAERPEQESAASPLRPIPQAGPNRNVELIHESTMFSEKHGNILHGILLIALLLVRSVLPGRHAAGTRSLVQPAHSGRSARNALCQRPAQPSARNVGAGHPVLFETTAARGHRALRIPPDLPERGGHRRAGQSASTQRWSRGRSCWAYCWAVR